MKIKLNTPVEKYVLIDKSTGEFYCGSGYTHSCVMYASSWDSLSSAKGMKTRYLNDVKRGHYHWGYHQPRILDLQIKKLVIDNYQLNDR